MLIQRRHQCVLAALLAILLVACGGKGKDAATVDEASQEQVEQAVETEATETEAAETADEEPKEEPELKTYSTQQISDALLALSHDGEDLALSAEEAEGVAVRIQGGRVVVTQKFDIEDYEIVTDLVRKDAFRTVALAELLQGKKLEAVDGSGMEPFQDATWIVSDTHGNVYFALTDSEGVFHTSSHALGLLPQMGGYVLSDTVYVAVGRRNAYIPMRTGTQPLDANGTPILAQGWLSMPDYLWTIAMPESTYETDESNYWYRDIIEIGGEEPEEEYYSDEWWY